MNSKAQGEYRELLKNISVIINKISAVHKRAKNIGLFVEPRDLLKCIECGLMEDVLYDGRLVTYYEGKKIDDTGLRFKRKGNGVYYCPGCGLKANC